MMSWIAAGFAYCLLLVRVGSSSAAGGMSAFGQKEGAFNKITASTGVKGAARPSFAVGVNTGSGVQDSRVPAIRETWLPKSQNNTLILSDTASDALGVTAVPPRYLCSTLHRTN